MYAHAGLYNVNFQVLGVILYTKPSSQAHVAHFGMGLKARITCMCMWRWMGMQQKDGICFHSGF